MTPASARFRRLAVATLVATYALIIVGGIVRATGSGDACPDWPRCHGELLPPLERDVLIEFSHRLIASVVGFLVLGTAIAAWRGQRTNTVVFWGSLFAVGLVIAQIILGGMTVLNDLSSSLVMAHLSLAATLLATLTVIAIASFRPLRLEWGGTPFRNLALVTAIATLALMLTGSYVSGTGAGLAFRDWPLFDGSVLPDSARLAVIHFTHRLAAAAIGLLVGWLALRAWQTQRAHPAVLATATAALAIYVAQIFVGAANVWTLLQPAARAAHLAVGALLWASLVACTVFAQEAVAGTPVRAGEPSIRLGAASGAQGAPVRRPS